MWPAAALPAVPDGPYAESSDDDSQEAGAGVAGGAAGGARRPLGPGVRLARACPGALESPADAALTAAQRTELERNRALGALLGRSHAEAPRPCHSAVAQQAAKVARAAAAKAERVLAKQAEDTAAGSPALAKAAKQAAARTGERATLLPRSPPRPRPGSPKRQNTGAAAAGGGRVPLGPRAGSGLGRPERFTAFTERRRQRDRGRRQGPAHCTAAHAAAAFRIPELHHCKPRGGAGTGAGS
jgi:hypothetical protein